MSRPLKLMLAAASLAAAGAVADGSAAQAAERVTIQRNGWVLAALLYRPAGPGPFPAVVGLHGCDGVITAGGKVGANYVDWGERLAAAGFLVLLPDSFGSRGLGSQCRASERRVRAFSERVADAQAARQWLQRQSFVIKDRVSLLGWSNGAIATLWAVRPQAGPQDGLPDFRSTVAFYPGCGTVAKAGWSARVPTSSCSAKQPGPPAGPCAQMVAAARRDGRGGDVSRRLSRLRPCRLSAARTQRPALFRQSHRQGARGDRRSGARPTRSTACPNGWRADGEIASALQVEQAALADFGVARTSAAPPP